MNIEILKFVFGEVGLDIEKGINRGEYLISKNGAHIQITNKPYIWIQGFKVGSGFYEKGVDKTSAQ